MNAGHSAMGDGSAGGDQAVPICNVEDEDCFPNLKSPTVCDIQKVKLENILVYEMSESIPLVC